MESSTFWDIAGTCIVVERTGGCSVARIGTKLPIPNAAKAAVFTVNISSKSILTIRCLQGEFSFMPYFCRLARIFRHVRITHSSECAT